MPVMQFFHIFKNILYFTSHRFGQSGKLQTNCFKNYVSNISIHIDVNKFGQLVKKKSSNDICMYVNNKTTYF